MDKIQLTLLRRSPTVLTVGFKLTLFSTAVTSDVRSVPHPSYPKMPFARNFRRATNKNGGNICSHHMPPNLEYTINVSTKNSDGRSKSARDFLMGVNGAPSRLNND